MRTDERRLAAQIIGVLRTIALCAFVSEVILLGVGWLHGASATSATAGGVVVVAGLGLLLFDRLRRRQQTVEAPSPIRGVP